MTTSTTSTPTTPTQATRARWLRAAVVIAPIGPLAVAILRGILPYDTTDDTLTIAEKAAANPMAQGAVVWLTYVALLTLPLGVLIASWLAVRTRPMLGGVAAVLSWVGFTSLFFVVGSDQLALAAPVAGVPAQTVAALGAAVDTHPATAVAGLVFVAGHILGAVLLGIALWRVIPRWAAVALIVSQPLHLVFAVVVPSHPLDALAWALTGVGFAAAAVVLARTGSQATGSGAAA